MKEEKLDVELSKEVANQSAKKINALKSTIENDKDVYISILKDFIEDKKDDNKFIKRICIALVSIIVVLIIGMVGISVYNQNLVKKVTEKHNEKMMEFLTNTEFETTFDISTDDYSTNHGNITFNK